MNSTAKRWRRWLAGMKTIPLACLAVLLLNSPCASAALMYEKYSLVWAAPYTNNGSGPDLHILYDNSFSEIRLGQGLVDLWVNGDSYAVKNGVVVGNMGRFVFTPALENVSLYNVGGDGLGEYFFGYGFSTGGKSYDEAWRNVLNPQTGQIVPSPVAWGNLRRVPVPESGHTSAMLAASLALLGLVAKFRRRG